MAGTVSVEYDSDYVKVFVNEHLHIHFLKKDYRGMSSYHENIYTVEIVLKNNKIKTEYDNRLLWIDVLIALDEAL